MDSSYRWQLKISPFIINLIFIRHYYYYEYIRIDLITSTFLNTTYFIPIFWLTSWPRTTSWFWFWFRFIFCLLFFFRFLDWFIWLLRFRVSSRTWFIIFITTTLFRFRWGWATSLLLILLLFVPERFIYMCYYEELELDDEDLWRFGQSRALKKNVL